MKLKKGSAAAKAYMAKIRAKRKTKVSGTKKATFKPSLKKAAKKAGSHTDTKSHNVRISVVSGLTTAKTALKHKFETLQGRLLTLTKAADKRKVQKEIKQVKRQYHKLNKIK